LSPHESFPERDQLNVRVQKDGMPMSTMASQNERCYTALHPRTSPMGYVDRPRMRRDKPYRCADQRLQGDVEEAIEVTCGVKASGVSRAGARSVGSNIEVKEG
jgi:hypothetical protein